MNSLAKIFELSSRAAARVGPKTARPRRWSSSTRPSESGSSGPTTVRSTARRGGEVGELARSRSTAIGTSSASLAMPGLPGAQISDLDARALRELPRHRVLAAAAADEEDFHAIRGSPIIGAY